MKTTAQGQSQPFNTMVTPVPEGRDVSESGQTVVDKVSAVAQVASEQFEERGAEMIDRAKRKVGEVYDQANKSLNEQYEKAMDFGLENPGKTALIAFGVGVGVGLLVAGGFNARRSRRHRMVEPVRNALSTLAHKLFR